MHFFKVKLIRENTSWIQSCIQVKEKNIYTKTAVLYSTKSILDTIYKY